MARRERISPEHELFLMLFIISLACGSLIALTPEKVEKPKPEEKAQPTAPVVIAPPPKPPIPDPPKPPEPQKKLKRATIIPISGAEAASFSRMTASVPPSGPFFDQLTQIARDLDATAAQAHLDAVEIVGHADTTLMRKPGPIDLATGRRVTAEPWPIPGDFDRLLAAWAKGDPTVRIIPTDPSTEVEVPSELESVAVSNVNLGMMRALAVARFFQSIKQQRLPRTPPATGTVFDGVKTFIPLSAGAFVRTDYTLDLNPSGNEESHRRRLDLRLFSISERLSDQVPAKSQR